MTNEVFQSVLKLCEVAPKDGWLLLPEGRQLTVHLASNGVGLTISKISRLRTEGAQVEVRTLRDETFVFVLTDAFACAFEDSTGGKARRAGFA
jgi:hypothetical protein